MLKLKMRRLKLDSLRGIAILMVVAIHVSANYAKMSNYGVLYYTNAAIESVLIGLAVPLFLVVSGIALSSKYHGVYGVRTFYWKRAKMLLLPWALAWAFYSYFGNTTHLWYFRLIAELYILYPVMIWFYESFERHRKEWAFLGILLAWQVMAMWLGGPVSVRWWFYMGVGIHLGRKGFNGFSWPVLDELGKVSFGIYIIHILFLGVAVRVLAYLGINQNHAAFYPYAFILTLFPSWLSVKLFHLTKGVINEKVARIRISNLIGFKRVLR